MMKSELYDSTRRNGCVRGKMEPCDHRVLGGFLHILTTRVCIRLLHLKGTRCASPDQPYQQWNHIKEVAGEGV